MGAWAYSHQSVSGQTPGVLSQTPISAFPRTALFSVTFSEVGSARCCCLTARPGSILAGSPRGWRLTAPQAPADPGRPAARREERAGPCEPLAAAAARGEDRWGERRRRVRLSARRSPAAREPLLPAVCAALPAGNHGVQRGGRRRQRRGGGEGEWQEEEEAGRPGHDVAYLLQRRHDRGVSGRGRQRGASAGRGAVERGRRGRGQAGARRGRAGEPGRGGAAGRGALLACRALPNTVQRCQPPARRLSIAGTGMPGGEPRPAARPRRMRRGLLAARGAPAALLGAAGGSGPAPVRGGALGPCALAVTERSSGSRRAELSRASPARAAGVSADRWRRKSSPGGSF